MELKDKVVVFLGDSITEGVGASCVENSYPQVFAKISGAKVYNFGVSGTRYSKQFEEFEPNFNESFIQRISRMPEYADVVVVFGGTNDFGHGDAPFGTYEDKTDGTYCGACYFLYKSLIEKYPNARIVIATPLHRLSENSKVKEIRNIPTRPLIDYVEVQRHIAEYFSLPVIDLFKISGMQPSVPVICEKYMPDGLHPSDSGAKRIAEIMLAQLLAL